MFSGFRLRFLDLHIIIGVFLVVHTSRQKILMIRVCFYQRDVTYEEAKQFADENGRFIYLGIFFYFRSCYFTGKAPD